MKCPVCQRVPINVRDNGDRPEFLCAACRRESRTREILDHKLNESSSR